MGELVAESDGRARVKTDTLHRREVGMTLVCPQCDLAVVVVDLGDAALATLTCHATMRPARPIRCRRVYPQPPEPATVAGALYTDEHSGLAVRCTRPGAGTLRLDERLLSPATGQLLRRTSVQRQQTTARTSTAVEPGATAALAKDPYP